MRLTVVGCSGTLPAPGSPASCYLVEAGATRLVLDIGSGAIGPLQQVTDLDTVDAVLLSHLHPDHYLDLCGWYVHRRYRPGVKPSRPLAVFGPGATPRRLSAAYDTSEGQLMKEFEFRKWNASSAVQVNDVNILVAAVAHSGESYAIRVEHGGRSLVYSGDTGPTENLVELGRDADVLLCEASFAHGDQNPPALHLTGVQAGSHARGADVGRLVLTHLPPWREPADALAEAQQTYDGPVEVACPGLVLDV